MADLKLHLDADASSKALLRGLLDLGHDVTRTPNEWMAFDASDEAQLLGATAHGRCIFSFNVRDFVALATTNMQHMGIVLAVQSRWTLAGLLASLDRMFRDCESDTLSGRFVWLNEWRLRPAPRRKRKR